MISLSLVHMYASSWQTSLSKVCLVDHPRYFYVLLLSQPAQAAECRANTAPPGPVVIRSGPRHLIIGCFCTYTASTRLELQCRWKGSHADISCIMKREDWKRWCCVPFINFFLMVFSLDSCHGGTSYFETVQEVQPSLHGLNQVICMGLMQGVQLYMAHEAWPLADSP